MSHLPPIASTPAHLEETVVRDATPIVNTSVLPASPIPAQTRAASSLALSFAFDTIEKTLNVVIKDERSGEVVRTIEYTQIPADLHRSDKLNGLLLDQFV